MKDAPDKTGPHHSLKAASLHERSLSARLLEVQDQERRRISRELHDSVGQSLVAVKMNLGMVKRKLPATELKEIEDAQRMIDEVLTKVRTVSHLLHPPTLDLMGLRSAISPCADAVQQRWGINVSLDMPDGSGWSVVRGVRKMNLATRVIIFSHFDQSSVRQAAKNAGCHGNVSKARARRMIW